MVMGFDVDDTLIMHDFDNGTHDIFINDPYVKDMVISGRIHTRHVELLKRSRAQGYFIIVWSGGGKLWADAVVDALGIREYVNFTTAKMVKFVDDLPAQEVLVNRIYLNEKGNIQDEQEKDN